MFIITVTISYMAYDESHNYDHHENDLRTNKYHADCAFYRSTIDTMHHEREFQALLKHHNLDNINPRSFRLIIVHYILQHIILGTGLSFIYPCRLIIQFYHNRK